jgi:hypothetical protein
MSAHHVMAMPPIAGSTRPGSAVPAGEAPAGAGALRGGRWRAWLARFGLAEVCGTLAAVIGFAVGYLGAGSLLAAAGLATVGEAIGFYGCVGARTAAEARRATAHLAGFRRLAAGAWHAVTQQLASCAVAEVLDSLAIRPGCVAGVAWLARSLPGGVWFGFAIGKVIADLAWYGMEAAARRGVARSLAAGRPGIATHRPALSASLPVLPSGLSIPGRAGGGAGLAAWAAAERGAAGGDLPPADPPSLLTADDGVFVRHVVPHWVEVAKGVRRCRAGLDSVERLLALANAAVIAGTEPDDARRLLDVMRRGFGREHGT